MTDVRKSVEVDLALIDALDKRIAEVELHLDAHGEGRGSADVSPARSSMRKPERRVNDLQSFHVNLNFQLRESFKLKSSPDNDTSQLFSNREKPVT